MVDVDHQDQVDLPLGELRVGGVQRTGLMFVTPASRALAASIRSISGWTSVA